MHFIALTIFPELFASFREHGIIRRAIQQNLISLDTIQLRDFASGKHRVTDDRPYGGGCGMVMKPEPLAAALRAARNIAPAATAVLLSPQGRRFDQATARELTSLQSMILVCGRYEGIDDRILHDFIDLEVSIGDYVLTGGELPAMIVIETITRLIPGALGGESSADNDSFSNEILDCGHFTRPAEFEGQSPPGELLSGNHREIERWRLKSALIRTVLKRKDLLEKRALSRPEIEILKNWQKDIEKIIRAQSSSGTDSPSGIE
jgi:tRNA (guanine37-N1)-methyltransferase